MVAELWFSRPGDEPAEANVPAGCLLMDQILMKMTRLASVRTEETHGYLASIGVYRLG
jgi:hypothetical protein